MAPKTKTESISVRGDALAGEKVIITGEIDGQSRKSAEQILVNAGATIEKSLNKKVTLVVLGENAGQAKLDKIEKLGCETKEWNDLIEEIKGDGSADADDADDAVDPKEDNEPKPNEDDEPEPKVEEPKPKKTKTATKANIKAKADPEPAPKSSGSGSDPEFLRGKTVIITGTIPGHERKAVQEILENAGASFAKSLNKSVELVVVGTKPGPDKLKKIEDLGAETIKWAELADKLGLEVAPEKKAAEVEPGEAPDSIQGMTLLITGEIDGHTRSSAQKILEAEGAKFAKSLTKAVELVVLGTNAGPDKLAQIKEKGIDTCDWDDLVKKLGIDVDTAQPPRKRAKKTKHCCKIGS